MGKYIDLRCDFGFKYCMSDPIVMMSFLNAILEGDEDTITSVNFETVEIPRESVEQRGVIFDLLCTTDKGDTILIEMQNSHQKYFKTRANFYVYNLLRKKIGRGVKWDKMECDISKIIGIFILSDKFEEFHKVITRTAECDLDEGDLFWDRHRKYFVYLHDFVMDENNITTKNIWINCFKNLGKMDKIHSSVMERADEGLKRLLEKANIAALTEEERDYYEASMKRLEDEIDMEEHGFERGFHEGKEEGREEGIGIGEIRGERNKAIKIATDMKKEGLDYTFIQKYTGLSFEEIDKL